MALVVHDYYVEVHTADEGGAGTDANVYLQMNGARGDTGRRKLLVSETDGNKFEKGEVRLGDKCSGLLSIRVYVMYDVINKIHNYV